MLYSFFVTELWRVLLAYWDFLLPLFCSFSLFVWVAVCCLGRGSGWSDFALLRRPLTTLEAYKTEYAAATKMRDEKKVGCLPFWNSLGGFWDQRFVGVLICFNGFWGLKAPGPQGFRGLKAAWALRQSWRASWTGPWPLFRSSWGGPSIENNKRSKGHEGT